MWSYIFCLALLAPAVFAKSVTLQELKRALNDYLEEERGDDLLGDTSNLFGGTRELAPIGGGVGTETDLDPSSLFGSDGARSGPMAQLDMRSLFKTQGKRDSQGMAKRLLQAVEETEAALEAGQQLRRTKKSERTGHEFTLCVFCDDMCLNQIGNEGYNSDDYFAAITTDMNQYLASLDPTGTFTLSFKLIPGSDVYLDWFGDSSLEDEELLTAINTAFWEGTGLYSMATGYGCDVDFLLASSDDPAWENMGSVEGIANMMQLCQMSYSTVKMDNSGPEETAVLMAHEFGHMIGAYHDGSLNSAYTSLASYFGAGQMLGDCEAEYAALEATCTASVSGYIMASSVGGASEYSPCTGAYFDMFICLADVMPAWYSLACV